jgi:DNA-binding MarR family transcriptional regulator
VTEQHWGALRALAATGQQIDAGGLAETCCLLPASLTRVLCDFLGRDLKARGLIARHTSAQDQRVSEISVTVRGGELIADVGPIPSVNIARSPICLARAIWRVYARCWSALSSG